MSKLKSLSKLPWFDMENYACVSTWDDEMLFWQLNERRFMLVESDKTKEIKDDLTIDVITTSLTNPSSEVNILGRGTKQLSGGQTVFGKFEQGHQDRLVKSMSNSEVLILAQFVRSKPKATLEEAVKGKSTIGSHRYVKINMSANRAQIKEEFSQWLDSVKKAGGDIDDLKSKKNAVRNKIIEYNLIPYIDLCIWENLSGIFITNRLIVETVRPDAIESPEKETTKLNSWATKALSNNFFASLRD
jgi:hypothetical protein